MHDRGIVVIWIVSKMCLFTLLQFTSYIIFDRDIPSKTLFELLHVGEFGLRIHICDHMFLVWFQYNIINIGISHPEKFYVLHLYSIFERAFLVLKILFRDGEDSFCAQFLSRQAQKTMSVSQNLQKLHAVANIPVCFSKAMGNEGGMT